MFSCARAQSSVLVHTLQSRLCRAPVRETTSLATQHTRCLMVVVNLRKTIKIIIFSFLVTQHPKQQACYRSAGARAGTRTPTRQSSIPTSPPLRYGTSARWRSGTTLTTATGERTTVLRGVMWQNLYEIVLMR